MDLTHRHVHPYKDGIITVKFDGVFFQVLDKKFNVTHEQRITHASQVPALKSEHRVRILYKSSSLDFPSEFANEMSDRILACKINNQFFGN